MTEGRYEQPAEATVDDVRAALDRGDSAEASSALVGASLGGADPEEVERLCRELLGGSDRAVAGVAATCLGHLARLAGSLGEESLDALRAHLSDPDIGGRVDDALDDVETFTELRR